MAHRYSLLNSAAGLLSLILLCSCAHNSKIRELKKLPESGPVALELKPSLDLQDTTRYHSRSLTKTFSSGDLTRKISEAVDFTVETKVTQVDEAKKRAIYKMTTTAKSGKADLNDFALPELNQDIEFTLTSTAKVLKVGEIAPGTLFYVPPISLPEVPVKVGETWPMRAEWVSVKSGIPLRMEIISIFKGLRDCGSTGPCAEIDISGDVTIIGAPTNPLSSHRQNADDLIMRFRSQVTGTLLFSLSRGLVLYSLVRSDETLSGEKDTVQIASCMLTYLDKPETDRVAQSINGDCDPSGSPTL